MQPPTSRLQRVCQFISGYLSFLPPRAPFVTAPPFPIRLVSLPPTGAAGPAECLGREGGSREVCRRLHHRLRTGLPYSSRRLVSTRHTLQDLCHCVFSFKLPRKVLFSFGPFSTNSLPAEQKKTHLIPDQPKLTYFHTFLVIAIVMVKFVHWLHTVVHSLPKDRLWKKSYMDQVSNNFADLDTSIPTNFMTSIN